MGLRPALIASLALFGCARDTTEAPDAMQPPPNMDAEVVVDRSVDPPQLPMSAAPPVFVPCPSGWSERSVDDLVVCEPFPNGREDCPEGQAHLLGSAGCVRLGSACGADGWPSEIDVAGPRLYVRSDAPAGGDGTAGAPLATIGEALDQAILDPVIVLHAGSHVIDRAISESVAIVGACSESTELSAANTLEAVLNVRNQSSVRVSGVRIQPVAQAGVYVSGSSMLTLSSVVIDAPARRGIEVWDAAMLDANRIVIRNSVPGTSSFFDAGVAIAVSGGAHAELRSSWVDGCTGGGVVMLGATVTLEDVLISGFSANPANRARGVHVLEGGVLEARRVVVESGISRAFEVLKGTATIEQSIARRIDNLPDGWAYGLIVNNSLVSASKLLVEEIEGHGVAQFQGRQQLTLTDVVIRGIVPTDPPIQATPIDLEGMGVLLLEDVAFVGTRLAVLDNAGAGLGAACGGKVELADAIIRRMSTNGIIGSGFGLIFRGETSRSGCTGRDIDVSLARVLLSENAFAGAVMDNFAVVTADDLEVRGGSAIQAGYGLRALGSARLTAHRVAIRDAAGAALVGTGSSALTVEDLTIERIDPWPDRTSGVGIWLDDATLDLNRAAIREAHGAGLAGYAARATASHVDIREIRASACLDAGCEIPGVGHGVFAVSNPGQRIASLRLTRFRVASVETAGVVVGESSEIDLETGEVTMNAIGAAVVPEGFDLARLQNDVLFTDNETPLSREKLPLPDVQLPD